MGQVTVRVGGYAHPVSCQDGQEQHLERMAAEVDKRVSALRAMGLQFSETRMLLLAALQLADETTDLTAEVAELRAGGGAAMAPQPAAVAVPDQALAERLARVALKIEGIAATLEGT
ncbi:MAG TPA: cell division protein ZapA [Acetobacteraceae bacterium]|nr:cell division protein ZapA [Acetobacteraceae bacterium]